MQVRRATPEIDSSGSPPRWHRIGCRNAAPETARIRLEALDTVECFSRVPVPCLAMEATRIALQNILQSVAILVITTEIVALFCDRYCTS